MEKCLNCNYEYSGEYCNNCGQRKIKGHLTLKMVFADFVQTVFLFDGKLYKTTLQLLVKPGKLVNSYLDGKRSTYLPPFQFFIFYLTLYLLVLKYFGDSYFTYINGGLQIQGDELSKAEFIQTLVRKNLNILYFIFTPIIALFVRVFYSKSKSNYAEVLIFAIYTMGIALFLSSIIVVSGQIDSLIFMLKFIIIFVYFPFAIVQFTNSKSIGGFFKALLTVVLSYLTFAIAITTIAGLYVILVKG